MNWEWEEDKKDCITYVGFTDNEKDLITCALYDLHFHSNVNDKMTLMIQQLLDKITLANPCDKGVIFQKMKVPEQCANCPAETSCGSCGLLPMVGIEVGIQEFDDEWFAARKENRKLKYCPLKEVRS